ncbi:MAG: hypothetical protein RW306_14660 [Geobacteraceae bacterium]|nr:hypothetical protein [Geobacteraceae bacterium]
MANNLTCKCMTTLLITLTAAGAFSAQAAPSGPLANVNGDHAHRYEVKADSGKWRRDPFIGNETKSARQQTAKTVPGIKMMPEPSALPEINLQGILQSGKVFHALINGRVVKSGDKLDSITIKEISRFQVVVQSEKKEKITYDIYQGRIDRGKK